MKYVLLLLLATISACQSTEKTNAQTNKAEAVMIDKSASAVLPEVTQNMLESNIWRLSEAKLADGSRYDALLDTTRQPLELAFKNGNVMINGSCNQLGADYTIANKAVTFGLWISTRMACHGELGKLDALATGAVTGTYTVFRSGERLGIIIENDTSTVEFLAKKPS